LSEPCPKISPNSNFSTIGHISGVARVCDWCRLSMPLGQPIE